MSPHTRQTHCEPLMGQGQRQVCTPHSPGCRYSLPVAPTKEATAPFRRMRAQQYLQTMTRKQASRREAARAVLVPVRLEAAARRCE